MSCRGQSAGPGHPASEGARRGPIRGHRLAARRGQKKATVAVGHAILLAAYHLLRDGTAYRDLGPAHVEGHDREAVERCLVRRLQRLGYKVTLEPAA